MVMKAMRAVKQGKTATLGKLYHSSIPAFGPRGWTLTIPGTPTGGPFGQNALVYHDELVGVVARADLLRALEGVEPAPHEEGDSLADELSRVERLRPLFVTLLATRNGTRSRVGPFTRST